MEIATPEITPHSLPGMHVLDAVQLRNLLHDLALTTSVSIRIRMENHPWPVLFSQVLVVTSKAILLAHIPTRTVTYLYDLAGAEEFELDSDHDIFSAFTPYTLKIKSPPLNHQINGRLHA
ncbi:MAG: hypothetical protein M3Y60_13400 [Bacteroidota bacterium]|nr:hypothetical protein [Bacteroidota bacterium]